MNILSTHINQYGFIKVTDSAFEMTMIRYLPESPRGMFNIIADRINDDDVSSSLRHLTVTMYLMILADLDHNVDESPFSVDAYRALKAEVQS